MSQLPDVPPSPPSLNAFLSRVKLAFIDLFARVTVLEGAGVSSFTHEHITDFNKAVLDVLGNGGLTAGANNIQVTYDPIAGVIEVNGFHHHVHGDVTDFVEAAQDAVAAAMVAGSNVTIVYDDALNTITISATGGGGGGGGPPFVSTDITDFNEAAQDAVAAILVAGPNVTIVYNDASNTITISAVSSGGGGVPIGYIGAWENGVTTGNTAATNTANLNSLIAATSVAGGGTIYFSTPGAYQVNATIVPKSHVSIIMVPGAYLTWTAGGTGVVFGSSGTEVLVHCKYEINIDEGTSFSGKVVNLHSCQYNDMKILAVGSNAGSVFVFMAADSTAGEFPWGGRNTVFNRFHFEHRGRCQYGMIIQGITLGFGGQAQGVTDNEFYSCQFANVVFRGIKINEWSDSNTFSGNTYMGLSGSGGIGVIVNEGHTNNYTVYNTHFEHLSIDTFGIGLGRTGVVLNESKMMFCDEYFNDPEAENGHFVATLCLSYRWATCKPATNDIYLHEKGFSRGL